MTQWSRPKTLRSPKGLIGLTSRPAGEGEGLKFEQIGPNDFAFKPIAGEMICSHIAFLRDWATAAINLEGKDPAQYQKIIEESAFTDRAHCAALMLKKLEDVEGDLIDVEQCSDADAVRRNALNAINHALVLAFYVHALTVADNEAAIFTGTRISRSLGLNSRAANTARHAERDREWLRWNAEAKQIWERHPKLSRQAVASRVKKNLGLDEAVRTIAKRLTKPVMAR